MPAKPGLAGDVRRAGVAAPTEEEPSWHPAAPGAMRRKADGHQAGAGHRGPGGARRLRGGGGTEPLMQRQLLCGVEALEAWLLEDDGKNHGKPCGKHENLLENNGKTLENMENQHEKPKETDGSEPSMAVGCHICGPPRWSDPWERVAGRRGQEEPAHLGFQAKNPSKTLSKKCDVA